MSGGSRSAVDLDASFVPRQASGVFTVTVDGESVLLDEDEHRLHHLNAPATLVWSCLDGRATVAELAAELSEELTVPYATVLGDTIAIVRDLAAQGLLHGVRPTTEPGAGSAAS